MTTQPDRPRLDDLSRDEASKVSYFGFCPECRRPPTGGGNIRSDHWKWCDDCRTVWYIGSNLFSHWRDEEPHVWGSNLRYLREQGFRQVESAHWMERPPDLESLNTDTKATDCPRCGEPRETVATPSTLGTSLTRDMRRYAYVHLVCRHCRVRWRTEEYRPLEDGTPTPWEEARLEGYEVAGP